MNLCDFNIVWIFMRISFMNLISTIYDRLFMIVIDLVDLISFKGNNLLV